MKQVFASQDGELRRRWTMAFPEAAGDTLAAALATGSRIVVMSATPSEAEAFQALNAGAAGYCHLEAAPEQLREIALVVGHGGLWMPPSLLQRLLALSVRTAPISTAAAAPALAELTAREREVAEQVALGASNSEIADALGITGRTVKAHLTAIFAKLGVWDRVQLALMMRGAADLNPVS